MASLPLRDLKQALRVSMKSPGFTLLAAFTLAIGIAANTVVFGWIDTVLVKPLPGVTSSERLAVFETVTPSGEYITTSYADYRDYRDHLTLLDGLAISQPRSMTIGEDEGGERVWGELVSGNFFSVLGVRPARGRFFTPQESGDRQGASPVAVIGYGLWQRKFGSDPAAIGSTVRINRQQLTIVGIAPPEFRGSITGLALEMWIPATMATALNIMPDWMLKDRKTRSFLGIARLKPGVSLERARSEVSALAKELDRANPATNRGIGAALLPVWRGHFGAQSMLLGPLRILMAVSVLVLLIACANVANLLLARAMKRRREFALRLALGSGRLRLARQLLFESLVPAALGTIIGVALAAWCGGQVTRLVPAGALPVVINAQMNLDILLFMALLATVACVLSGLAPAIHTGSMDLNEAIRDGGRNATGGGRSGNLRRLLVAAEVALAMVTIIGAGLFSRSFEMARRLNPGFDARNVLVSHLYLSTGGYSAEDRKLLCRRIRERLEVQPGIQSATYADVVPLAFEGAPWEDLQIEGYVPRPDDNLKISRNVVAPGFFDLMRIPLLSGRDFNQLDDEKSQQVMIVTQAFARRFLNGRNPIGVRVRGWGRWFTIVGVAKDTKHLAVNEAPRPFFYVPFQQVYRADLDIVMYVRTAGDPSMALAALRREIRAAAPNAGGFNSNSLTEEIGASLFPQKIAAALMGVMGIIAILLAAAGLYSVMAYAVSQRTQEIGIRMAIGARPGQVLGLVVLQGMGLASAGLAAGFAVALILTRFASSLLVGVSATDPLVFAGSALLLIAVALAASYLPALRAARIDPGAALRSE
jgi:predicted permease